MSARRRRESRRLPDYAERWHRVEELRNTWLGHALRTAPADRAATETAIGELYRLIGRPPPEFRWVSSPAEGVRTLVPPKTFSYGQHTLGAENELANLVSGMRARFDRRVGTYWPANAPPDPVAALESGTSWQSIVNSCVHGVLRQVVRDAIGGMLRAAMPERLGLTWFGQHDAHWIAYYQVHHQVLGMWSSSADLAQLELWATLARSCGWWWPRDGVCVVSERPSLIRTEPLDEGVRLHAETSKAIGFSDGWGVYSWHGTRVPSWVIENPTVERIDREANIEVRRCAIERLGWPAYIEQAGLSEVGRADDPGNPGCELRLFDLPREFYRLLLAVNGSVERDGTRRQYGLRVPLTCDNPLDAAGWSYGLSGAEYARLQRRT